MSIGFCDKVFEGGITSTTAVQTSPELYRRLASVEKYAIQARVTQVTAGTPTITVAIEHSNEGIAAASWATKATPISAVALTASIVNFVAGTDAGTTPGMCNVRLSISLGGTGTVGAYVEVWVTGRNND